MSSKHKKLPVCPNCGTSLKSEDNYCPNCGQENHELKLPLGHLLYEFVESITHFDNKLWNTMKAIFTRPGSMTADFLAGKRARFVPPARLYVFISVIFFFLITKFADYRLEKSRDGANGSPLLDMSSGEKLSDIIKNDSLMAARDLLPVANVTVLYNVSDYLNGKAMTRLRALSPAQQDSLLLKSDVDTTLENRRRLQSALKLVPEEKKAHFYLGLIPADEKKDAKIEFRSEEERALFEQKTARMKPAEVDSVIQSVGGSMDGAEHSINRIIVRQGSWIGGALTGETRGMQEFLHIFLKKLSVIMFVLMPFVAFLLWIFYARTRRYRRYYYEHLIFSVHAHSVIFLFFSLAFGITYFMSSKTTDQVLNWTLIVCWLYFLLSLKRVYQQSWLRTIVKFIFLSVVYSITIFFFFLLAIGLGVTSN